jgi:ribonucleoside-triphosphate reductase
MINNVEAVLAVMQHIYDNIMYAELNTKLDTCQKCGYQGEIEMVKNENGKYVWRCPNCGNTEAGTMNVIRRVCGYLSNANEMCQGRLGDIHDRVMHL